MSKTYQEKEVKRAPTDHSQGNYPNPRSTLRPRRSLRLQLGIFSRRKELNKKKISPGDQKVSWWGNRKKPYQKIHSVVYSVRLGEKKALLPTLGEASRTINGAGSRIAAGEKKQLGSMDAAVISWEEESKSLGVRRKSGPGCGASRRSGRNRSPLSRKNLREEIGGALP